MKFSIRLFSPLFFPVLILSFLMAFFSHFAQALGKTEANQYCGQVPFFSQHECQKVAARFAHFSPAAIQFCARNQLLSLSFPERCLAAIGGKSYFQEDLEHLQVLVSSNQLSDLSLLFRLAHAGSPITAPVLDPKRFDAIVSGSGFNAVTANTPYALEQIRSALEKEAEAEVFSRYQKDIDAYLKECFQAGGQSKRDLMAPGCSLRSWLDLSGNQWNAFDCNGALILRCV